MNWSPMIQEVVNGYQEYLKLNCSEQHQKSFNDLLTKNHEEAAISEAVVFNWLCQNNLNPGVEENKSTGGMDFICSYNKKDEFVVEVTCLKREELAMSTGLSVKKFGGFRMPTKEIRTRISNKAKKLSGYEMPRVLAITSLHDAAPILLNSQIIPGFFLVSGWKLNVPIGNSDEDFHLSTDLQEAIFFRFKGNSTEIEYCRESVSAVLLISITGNGLCATGYLHPKPTYSLNAKFLSAVPFLKVKNNLIRDGEILTEWINAAPYSASFPLDLKI